MTEERRPCPSTYTIGRTGEWRRCTRERGHDGDHVAEVNGRVVIWPNG